MKNLIEQIRSHCFRPALKILKEEGSQLKKDWCDQNGDTLMHYIIRAHIEYSMKYVSEPTIIYSLVEEALKFGFSCNSENNNKLRPIEFLEKVSPSERLCSKGDLGKAHKCIVEKFERYTDIVFNGRKFVPDVCLTWFNRDGSEIQIPDTATEANELDGHQLRIFQRHELLHSILHKKVCALKIEQEKKKASDAYINRTGNHNLTNIYFVSSSFKNFVSANLGFLIVDENMKPIKFLSIPIQSKFNIVERGTSYSHSEDGLIRSLDYKLSEILESLKPWAPFSYGICAVTLDIYSTHEICIDCEKKLHELQTDGFFQALKEHLLSIGFTLNENIKLSIRAAGFRKFDYPYSNHNSNISYPDSMVCETFNKDINKHDKAVILHLAPLDSATLSNPEDKKKTADCYNKREIFIVRPGQNFALRIQTAFSSGSGKDIERHFLYEIGFPEDDVVKIDYETIHELHLESSYYQFWCVPHPKILEALSNITLLTQKSAWLILGYLYGNPNNTTNAELKNVITSEKFKCDLSLSEKIAAIRATKETSSGGKDGGAILYKFRQNKRNRDTFEEAEKSDKDGHSASIAGKDVKKVIRSPLQRFI